MIFSPSPHIKQKWWFHCSVNDPLLNTYLKQDIEHFQVGSTFSKLEELFEKFFLESICFVMFMWCVMYSLLEEWKRGSRDTSWRLSVFCYSVHVEAPLLIFEKSWRQKHITYFEKNSMLYWVSSVCITTSRVISPALCSGFRLNETFQARRAAQLQWRGNFTV